MPKDRNFGKRLALLRKEKVSNQDEKETQEMVSKAIGVNERRYRAYEGGEIPKMSTLFKIVDYFKCNVDWLIYGRMPKYQGEISTNPATGGIPSGITEDELALIRTLRLCGDEYKKRVYVAATVRAQRVMEEKKLEIKEKLTAQQDLETLSNTAIE